MIFLLAFPSDGSCCYVEKPKLTFGSSVRFIYKVDAIDYLFKKSKKHRYVLPVSMDSRSTLKRNTS